ncbi:MAG: succinate--CoA ligase subunit alpha, partial [Pseudomonadota bacterium]
MLERLFSERIGVLVQGITGRAGRQHSALMRAYGTNIVGGVSGSSTESSVDGVPVFTDCRQAVAATGAEASVIMVPAFTVLAAIAEAIEAGIRLVVSVTEGMPVHDALVAARMAHRHGVIWIGPSTPGLAVPGRIKLGFLPDVALAPGPVGLMTKSGTLSYEIGYRLVQRGVGQTLWAGVGGDSVKGIRFA